MTDETPAAAPVAKRELKLPAWAKLGEPLPNGGAVVDADTDAFQKAWHSELAFATPDQYTAEVCYQCAKLDLQAALIGTEIDPQISQKNVVFNFSHGENWVLADLPAGRGVEAAAKGREARKHYLRVRGAHAWLDE